MNELLPARTARPAADRETAGMSLLEPLLAQPLVYRLWQAPFAQQKLQPFLAHAEVASAGRVLDVGSGPGTNAGLFSRADYLGLDWNDAYVRYAQRRYHGRFIRADARTFKPALGESFDCILVNSLLHHLSDQDVRVVLANLAGLLAEGGAIHIIELVLPVGSGPARLLAHFDRGDSARPLGIWRELFAEAFATEVFEPYDVGGLGIPLWHMVYFKGRRLQ
jgi:SAM-dependent methyltransferase